MNTKTGNVASALCCILVLAVSCAPHDTREQTSTRNKDAIRERLRKVISFEFIATPLPDALAFFSHLTGVPIVLDDEHVKDADGLEVTLKCQNVSADEALRWVLRLVQLGHVVRENDVLVTTRERVWWGGQTPVERTYSIEKLIDSENKASTLVEFIKLVIAENTWGKRGTAIKAENGKLIVVHIPKVHVQVKELIAQFKKARNKKPDIVEPLPPPPPFRVEGLKEEELLDICSTTFLHMFKDAEDWDQKVDRRFVSALGRAPKALLARLRQAGFKVQSPYAKDPAYADGWFIKGRYFPKGDTSLFYYVDDVRKVTVNDELEIVPNPDGGWLIRLAKDPKVQVIVSCSVVWHGLAGRGYKYVFEKQKDKWAIVSVTPTWMF